MENVICPRCNKPAYKNRITKGVCFNCYRKYFWKRQLIKCKRCGRLIPNHSKGYCAGCYHALFQMDRIRASNYKRLYGLDLETYDKITAKCVICGFDKIVDLHHLDMNKENKSPGNLIGLCPNHHQMLHSQYREEILPLLEQKGYKIKRTFEIRNKFRIYTNKEEAAPTPQTSCVITNLNPGMNYPSGAG